MPVSIAERDGLVYVANADTDGAFVGPADQSGNVTALRIDLATGQLAPVGNSARALGVRPSDVEFSIDGRHLLVSASNAGSASLPARSNAELSSFAVLADGTLSAAPLSVSASTEPGNAGGRNLPTAIGMETFSLDGRQFVIVAEARAYLPDGRSASLAQAQTGSVSSWEIAADGSLQPRSLDVLAGATRSSGPTGTGWIAIAPYDLFFVSSSTGATLSAFFPNPDGTVVLRENVARGAAAEPGRANPLEQADGFVDLVVTTDEYEARLYQLLGLKGSVAHFDIDGLVAYNIALRSVLGTGLLPTDNLQGIAAVSRRP